MLNTENRDIDLLISWGLSLVGRAPCFARRRGQEFNSPSLHQIEEKTKQRFVREFKQTAMLCAGHNERI